MKILDKGLLYHKLHQLQKRLYRSSLNEGHHSKFEDLILQKRQRNLLKKIKSKK